jgi:predicted TIM-barrel fold metal-dependent hydrolase
MILSGCELSDEGGRVAGAISDFNIHMQTFRQNQRLREVYVGMGHLEYLAQAPNKVTDATAIIQMLTAALVGKAAVLSMAYAWGIEAMTTSDQMLSLMMTENDFVAAECAKQPDRLIPFFSVNPLLNWAVEEIDRCFDQLHMTGLYLNFNGSNVSLKDPGQLQKVKNVFAHVDQRRIPVILHFSNGHSDFGVADATILIQEILLPHPDLKLQIAHLGGGGGYGSNEAAVFDAFIAAANGATALSRDHLFFDISGVVLTETRLGIPPTDPKLFPRITSQIQLWGVEHIRWGSDSWFADSPKDSLATIGASLTLSDGEYNTIVQQDWVW